MPLIRSANFNLFVEIVLRIGLLSAFCYMESMAPFVRVIHQSDMESEYKYPRRDSYVPGGLLWSIVLAVPCVLSLLAWAGCNDCNDAFEILMAWSLALGINGVLTDTVKLISGRPRPDFYYRCFPDGEESSDLQCTGDPEDIMDGRKSFPSGHSSLSFCSLGVASAWLCGRLGVLARRRGSAARVLAALAPLVLAACVALSRSCDYHHHWQEEYLSPKRWSLWREIFLCGRKKRRKKSTDILVGSTLGFTVAIFCYRQYYYPLSSDLAGVPYVVCNSSLAKYVNGKPETSPSKSESKEVESTPLLGARKEDKWI